MWVNPAETSSGELKFKSVDSVCAVPACILSNSIYVTTARCTASNCMQLLLLDSYPIVDLIGIRIGVSELLG
jgi:hypothetical protein